MDGDEDVHCLEDNPTSALAVAEMDLREWDRVIRKRRYSGFYGTDLEVL